LLEQETLPSLLDGFVELG